MFIIGLIVGIVVGAFVTFLCVTVNRADAKEDNSIDKDIREIFFK